MKTTGTAASRSPPWTSAVAPTKQFAASSLPVSEAAIDAYAQRVLERYASEVDQACPDDSLGPYVTSVLRNNGVMDVSMLPDYDGLIELLQEHCALPTEEQAKQALQEIAEVVRQNRIPAEELNHHLAPVAFYTNASSASMMASPPVIVPDDDEEFPTLSAAVSSDRANQNQQQRHAIISPQRADSLIPLHLLDEEFPGPRSVSDEQSSSTDDKQQQPHDEDVFPPLGAYNHKKSSAFRKKNAQPAADLAVALFRPARSRQSSVDETYGSTSAENATTAATTSSTMLRQHDTYVDPGQCDAVAHVLMTTNVDLSYEAAHAAAMLAQADAHAAQYVLQAALSAPPICRHLLQAGCYRSDCQFSHNLSEHTCLFWLRGRCGKGLGCRFLHGFHESVLNEYWQQQQDAMYYNGMTPSSSYDGFHHNSGFASSSSSWMSMETTMEPMSFANIASKGYKTSSSFANPISNGSNMARVNNVTGNLVSNLPTVKIPLDLWNPHENRDAAAFYIADPIERFHHVMSQHHFNASNVIDLHFQSTKTFGVVLEHFLQDYLDRHGQVWIVTGTGHHVGNKTHQKSGGALETAVLEWLITTYVASGLAVVYRGKDRNGQGGAVLVDQLQER